MIFIVYQFTEIDPQKKKEMSACNYAFILDRFMPVLQELGQVIKVDNPYAEVDVIYEDSLKRGESCCFISFSLPDKSAVGLTCPTTCFFAWEFSLIYDEVRDNDPGTDWRYVFKKHGRTATLSQYSADAVRKTMGVNFPVAAIPFPVWDRYQDFRNKAADFANSSRNEIFFNGNIIDNRNYIITPESFDLRDSFNGFSLQNWTGETIRMGFGNEEEYSACLIGFYHPEPWGTWSRNESPSVVLPYIVSGIVHLKIEANGYGHSVNNEINVTLGGVSRTILLRHSIVETVTFNLDKPANILGFSGLDLSPVEDAADHRTMGIGLKSIEISGQPGPEAATFVDEIKGPDCKVSLDGIVYASVFNPYDWRKNWGDILKAFCLAFQYIEDATLVLKIPEFSPVSFINDIHYLFQLMCPMRCRIVVMRGYLDAAEYEKLIAAAHFYVNTSECEGYCLPVMEFMSCGKPAIAPNHTSFADYIDESNSLVVKSTVQPSSLPCEPPGRMRALKYRIDAESLVDAFRQSYDTVKNGTDVYNKMSESALKAMKEHASDDFVKTLLQRFFNGEGRQW